MLYFIFFLAQRGNPVFIKGKEGRISERPTVDNKHWAVGVRERVWHWAIGYKNGRNPLLLSHWKNMLIGFEWLICYGCCLLESEINPLISKHHSEQALF